MTATEQQQLGKTLWAIADDLRGAINADDFRDYMLSFLFLRYLSDNYEKAVKKELGTDYPEVAVDVMKKLGVSIPLAVWYGENSKDVIKYIENQSFENTFQGLFSEINGNSGLLRFYLYKCLQFSGIWFVDVAVA